MPKEQILKIVAWGQYVHWADLQFNRFMALDESANEATCIGVAAHWLASEYVVLEGWHQIGATDSKINTLISLYPDHQNILRKCRNAVYHFQTKPLDERIRKCLRDEDEEFAWAISLHFEFQRYLLLYWYNHKGTPEEIEGLLKEAEACIGWLPTETPHAGIIRVYKKCMTLAKLVDERILDPTDESTKLIISTLDNLSRIDGEPFTSRLKRVTKEG